MNYSNPNKRFALAIGVDAAGLCSKSSAISVHSHFLAPRQKMDTPNSNMWRALIVHQFEIAGHGLDCTTIQLLSSQLDSQHIHRSV
jgi:hypothetical protein